MENIPYINFSTGGHQVVVRKIQPGDLDLLLEYFTYLGPETRSRFGPHAFDRETLIQIYLNSLNYLGYIAIENETGKIIAYSVIKIGYLEHDSDRLCSYGLTLDARKDCTYAPSVSDEWQSLGVGKAMFQFILTSLIASGFKRIILWGGVQSKNEKAVNFYRNAGFRKLGTFEYKGMNTDMCLDL
ncbi:MAG: GNAT family N-acetyltransferase [Bacteroidetes bacterium]|nr:GNAT family N-acetyltransferase [Bacteroidota bacterium]